MIKAKPGEVKKELEKWDERVWYDFRFKDDDGSHIDKLVKIFDNSYQNIQIIRALNEPMCYKIGRKFVEWGVPNSAISFIDGKALKSYIGGDGPEWKKKEYIDQFFDRECYKDKWIIMPYIEVAMTEVTAIYMLSKLKGLKPRGIIFFSEGVDNFGDILWYNTEDKNLVEYPIAKHRRIRRKVIDTEEGAQY